MIRCQVPNFDVPCPYFFKCGGCDFLDLSEEKYRKLKQEQLATEADWIWVGAGSRRRIILQINKKNQLGFFAKKSHEIVEIEKCFVAEEKISQAIAPIKNFISKQEQNLFTQVAITLFDNGLDIVFGLTKELNFLQSQKTIAFAKENNFNVSAKIKNHLTPIFITRKNQIFFSDFKIDLDSEIFIQATKSGLESITKIIRNFIVAQQNIKNVVDIYAGFGAYSFAICDLVKLVQAFEGSETMVNSINKNAAANHLSQKISATVCDLFSTPITARELNKFDLAIINPPRNGASPQVQEISKSTLKNLVYVSCNPQSFSRDYKILAQAGFRILKTYALDQFYSTKHLELIVILTKAEKI